MNKELFILTDYVVLKSIEFPLLEKCDRLAMSPGAMLAFEQSKLSYLTFDDFYDYRRFRIDNTELIKATDNLFSALDKKYEPFLNFPRAFTGNIYWFLVFFTNIYYISRICEEIDKIYDRVYLGGSSTCQVLFKIDLEFSSKGLTFDKLGRGLNNQVSLFKTCLPSKCKCIWLDNICHNGFNLNINKYRLIYLLKRVPEKALLKLASFLSKCTHQKKAIFVIQDGYEVSALKKYMRGFLFINPVDRLLQMAREDSANSPHFNSLFTEELKKFVEKWFPNFEKYVFELFTLYHSKILCRLKSFSDNAKKAFSYYKPAALFYSIGAVNVHEDLYAYLANQRKIPIFYFQHGGTRAFFEYPYQKYQEQNKNIKTINIFQSRMEKMEEGFSIENLSSESRALGSIKLYKLHGTYKKGIWQQNRKKILYCVCPSSPCNYGSFTVNVSDEKLFGIIKDVVDVIDKFNLKMDIKPHPADEINNYLHFKELLKAQGNKKFRLLSRFPAEKIIKDYGLLILDYIASALVSVALILNIPVIMYLKDTSCLRKETMSDLEKIFYLVRNKSDLERYIGLYTKGKLKSKFSLEIVNKYVFPINAGNPGVRIADYIQGKTSEYNNKRRAYVQH